MKPDWYKISGPNHKEFLARAQEKGRLKSVMEIARFLALAICGEAGELANLFKKEWRGDEINTAKIADEMADVRIYLEHLADELGIDLDAACMKKAFIVEARLHSGEATSTEKS